MSSMLQDVNNGIGGVTFIHKNTKRLYTLRIKATLAMSAIFSFYVASCQRANSVVNLLLAVPSWLTSIGMCYITFSIAKVTRF